MSSQFPLVTIGLPVYNGERFLDESLDSILHQDYPNVEVVVSDNASTDGTRELLSQYERKKLGWRIVRQERNLGAIANYEFVLSQAHGKYFKWQAHDDRIRPGYLRECVSMLESDEEAVLAYTSAVIIDENGAARGVLPVVSPKYASRVFLERMEAVLSGYELPFYGVARRDALLKVVPFSNTGIVARVTLMRLSRLGRFLGREVPLLEFRYWTPDETSRLEARARLALRRRDPDYVAAKAPPGMEFMVEIGMARAVYYGTLGGHGFEKEWDLFDVVCDEVGNCFRDGITCSEKDRKRITTKLARSFALDSTDSLNYAVSIILRHPVSLLRDLGDLARLVKRRSAILTSRMWWGALRQAILRPASTKG